VGARPYASRGLGEVFVFVFFGLVATVGSQYVQDETLRLLATLAAIPVGALATALLVVNNLRDIPTDALAGKRTLAVRLGEQRTVNLLTSLVWSAIAFAPLLALLPAPPCSAAGAGRAAAGGAVTALVYGSAGALQPHREVAPKRRRGPALLAALGATGRCQLLYGVGLAVGLAWGGG
jgi:1,4-dihydroxy-2-naphthoate polyprenyltransferase